MGEQGAAEHPHLREGRPYCEELGARLAAPSGCSACQSIYLPFSNCSAFLKYFLEMSFGVWTPSVIGYRRELPHFFL